MGLCNLGQMTTQKWAEWENSVQYDTPWERRDVLGVHPQKQEGFSWAGACVPAGRLFPNDFYDFADACEK